MRVHRLAASMKVLLTIAILWLSGASVLLHSTMNDLGQMHGLQHPAALGQSDPHHHPDGAVAPGDSEGQQDLHGLFHNADTCSLAALAPQVPHAEAVWLKHSYTPVVTVLPLAYRFTHPLRPPIARA